MTGTIVNIIEISIKGEGERRNFRKEESGIGARG